MVPAPPPLPTRFPCWCRAIYSWGGEGSRDLGFIEGDLIECVNAGDGSWWTGRLWRDRRTVGSFPSNFVVVLPPDFRPTSRSASPNPTPSPTTVSPQKSKAYRKPFEAYAKAPHYTTAKQPETYRDGTVAPPARSRENSATSLIEGEPRGLSPISPSSPMQSGYDSRAPSPIPPPSGDGFASREPSPNPYMQDRYHYHEEEEQQERRRQHQGQQQHRYQYYHHQQQQQQQPQQPHNNHHNPYRSRAASPFPRAISPAPPLPPLRPASPAPHSPLRAASPAPPISHQPQRQYAAYCPEPDLDSPPPPPPPPHRHMGRNNSVISYQDPYMVSRQNSNASYNPPTPVGYPAALSRHGSQLSYDPRQQQQPRPPPHETGYHTPRMPSPCPPSPGGGGSGGGSSGGGGHMTPSPLREAMDGVIEQLDALGMNRDVDSPEPAPVAVDPWSPESFDMVGHRTRRKVAAAAATMGRSQTAMGLIPPPDEGYETWSGGSSAAAHELPYQPGGHAHASSTGRLPQLGGYVERMESRLRKMHSRSPAPVPAVPVPVPSPAPVPPPPVAGAHEAPAPPASPFGRPKSSMGGAGADAADQKLRHRKSAYEVGRSVLSRTFTAKSSSTNATNSTSTTASSGRSLMSGASAGAFSATSAGSYARRAERAQSALGLRDDSDRPETPFTGITYHSSHGSGVVVAPTPSASAPPLPPHSTLRPKSHAGPGFGLHEDSEAGLGGLVHPKAPKRNIFKKIFDSAKTGVASGRNTIALGGGEAARSSTMLARSMGPPPPPQQHHQHQHHQQSHPLSPAPMHGLASPFGGGREAAREMGLGSGVDWVQVRRDVNRSNSLSQIERSERRERARTLDHPVLNPVDELYDSLQGDEGADGAPVPQPINYHAIPQFGQVDKNTRFITSLPPFTTAVTLATMYVCRPYRSNAQRLRAIFTYVAEKISWEGDYDGQTRIDTRRVLQERRACAEEYAALVLEMCTAVGVQCEAVRGYLKRPGEITEAGLLPRPNHWWNAVVVDGEWRMIDCCLASPSNPRRGLYSSAGSGAADPWWFLARPSQICWTHVPDRSEQQHMCPPAEAEVLLNLPCACPPFFRNGLEMVDYGTALVRLEDLEMAHVRINVPEDVEVAAEVEVRTFSRDPDGDLFESGEVRRKRALAQAEWFAGVKRYTIKALLPGDEGHGVLKVYAGKRGLMHGTKDIPHPLSFALPIAHVGENPPYEFVTRYPTPHAQWHDIYVVQPQCQHLALNNTFVFAIRQHPSSTATNPAAIAEGGAGGAEAARSPSPLPFIRPGSAMSMTAGSSNASNSSSGYGTGAGAKKPAKMAIQTPGGKILRLMRKEERRGGAIGVGSSGARSVGPDEEISDGGTWETIIKCSERGPWRGLVLADRSAKWCVFAQWTCV